MKRQLHLQKNKNRIYREDSHNTELSADDLDLSKLSTAQAPLHRLTNRVLISLIAMTSLLALYGTVQNNRTIAFYLGHSPMMVSTAAGFLALCLGLVALEAKQKIIVTFTGLFVLLLGVFTLAQTTITWAFGFNDMLAVDLSATEAIDRMPAGISVCFILASCLLLFHERIEKTGNAYYNGALILFVMFPLLNIFAHIFAPDEIGTTPFLSGMSLSTSLMFLAFVLSLALMTHSEGAAGLLTRHTRYARNFRRLLFLVLILPLTVGSVLKYAIAQEWLGNGIGIAVFCLFCTLVITTTLAHHTLLIDHWVSQLLDEKRKSFVLRNQLHELLEIAPDGILLFDDNLKILHANSGAERILGHSAEELKNLYIEELIPPHQRNTSYMQIDQYIHSEESPESLNVPNRIFMQHKGGHEMPVSISLTKKKRGDQVLLIAIIKNMSHYDDKLRDLEKKAFTDALTQTLNRAAFQNFCERVTVHELRSSDNSFCVMLMDIDNFKSINDRYGHDAGDQVLQQFAKVAKSVLRHGDRLFRTGGEEFIVVTTNVDEYSARLFAERFRQAVQNHVIKHDAHPIRITCSIGVCVMDSDKRDLHQAVKRADEAMYHAKHAGKNRVKLSRSIKRRKSQATAS